jgi:hypothetical protein
MNTRTRSKRTHSQALLDDEPKPSVADRVADGEESSAKKRNVRRSLRLPTALPNVVQAHGWNESDGADVEENDDSDDSDADFHALFPNLCALDLPAPTDEQHLERKRLHKENLLIAKQQAKNRQVRTQKDYRVGYEREMSRFLTLSGKGTQSSNPCKTRTVEEARAALRWVKAERASSIDTIWTEKYVKILHRTFTADVKKNKHVSNPEWLIENIPMPRAGFASELRPLTKLRGESFSIANASWQQQWQQQCRSSSVRS